MTTPGAHSTSDTARLMVDPPGFAVGWQERVILPNPAVGAGWRYKADGRYLERVLAVSYTFTSSAVAGTRSIVLNLTDNNGVIIAQAAGSAAIAPSAVYMEFFNQHAPGFFYNPAVSVYHWLPDLLIPSDWQWQAVVTNMDVADQFTNVVLLVQRFPNDAAAITAG